MRLGIVALFISLITLSANAQQISYEYGEGLTIQSKDSNYKLLLSGRIQTLFVSEKPSNVGEAWVNELSIRRARIKMDGHVFSPKLVYKLEFGLSERDRIIRTDQYDSKKVPNFILDAVLKYKLTKNLEVWAGQTKLPGNRERVVSSQSLQIVDRSQVNSIFNLDREIGVQLRAKQSYGKMVVKQIGSLSLGEVRNSMFTNLGGNHYVARVEFLPFGEFKSKGDYFESDLKREAKPKLSFGFTYSYNDNAVRQTSTGRYLINSSGAYMQHDLATVLVDALIKYKGFSTTFEYANKTAVGDHSSIAENVGTSLIDSSGRTYFTGQGINLQSGYLFKNNFEVAGRYTRVTPDRAKSFKAQNEYTLALSKYIVGHTLKMQADVSYIDFDGTPSDEIRYRIQLEIGF